MDFSNIIISVIGYMARDLILYFIATWPSPDLFLTQDKKWISVNTLRESIEVLHDKKQKLDCIFEQ